MERSQPQASNRPPSTKLSPLRQHPVTPIFSQFPQDATQTIILNHPAARISSSPASSPRIIDAEPARRGSVHPAMSDTMEKGLHPGADFFDDSSESDWEDSEGDVTQTYSEAGSQRLKSLVHDMDGKGDDVPRGRSRERPTITALPLFEEFSAGYTEPHTIANGKPLPSSTGEKRTTTAQEMSVKRLNKDNVRVVHNRSNAGTPRDSLRTDGSSDEAQFPDFFKPIQGMRSLSEGHHESPSQRRHRRNTSGSIIAGSIINAHIMTMRALESLNQSPSGILSTSESRNLPFSKLSSFSSSRHITLPPLRTKSADRDRFRPEHLPEHFVRTPYPFTAKKEFPKPRSRPRRSARMGQSRPDSGYSEKERGEHGGTKGKHVLGLATSGGVYDLRSRLQRNEDAQGVVRYRSEEGAGKSESVVWLSMEKSGIRGAGASGKTLRLEKIVVPSNLTASTPHCTGRRGGGVTVDFDDEFFAARLRDGQRRLAGSWARRVFSARQLSRMRLAQVATWSGNESSICRSNLGLLAVGDGIELDADTRSPFTENGLMKLYHSPGTGKARYTWVHWAHRIAQSNTSSPQKRRQSRHALHKSLDEAADKNDVFIDNSEISATAVPDSITTIQFVHTLASTRIIAALMLMVLSSMVAPLLWIFLGANGTGWRTEDSMQRSDRVGSGMVIGILVLLLESVGFGAWVLFS